MATTTADKQAAEHALAQAVVDKYRDAGGYGERLNLALAYALEDLTPGIDWDSTEDSDEVRETVIALAESLVERTSTGRQAVVDAGSVAQALATLGVTR